MLTHQGWFICRSAHVTLFLETHVCSSFFEKLVLLKGVSTQDDFGLSFQIPAHCFVIIRIGANDITAAGCTNQFLHPEGGGI